MSIADLIHAAIPVSMGLIVLGLGMRCTLSEPSFFMHEPGLLLRSVIAMNVIMPAVAVLLIMLTELDPAVKVALVAMSVSPVPPILPPRQLSLVTRPAYVYGLLVAASILSIVITPVSLTIIGALVGRGLHIDAGLVAKAVMSSVLVPLAIGMLIYQLWPKISLKLSPVVGKIGSLLLLLAMIGILSNWRDLLTLIGDGTLMVCISLSLIGLLVGHWLGGPNEDDRSVLALATCSRHPGVAIAIGVAIFPGHKNVALAILMLLLVSTLVSLPYSEWRKRVHLRVIGAHTPNP